MNIPSEWVNLSEIAKANGKLFADFYRLNSTKALLDKLEKEYGKPQIIVVSKGKNSLRGSYGHPKIAIAIESWASAKRVKSYRFESHHRNKVAEYFPNSKTEVETPVGVCDVVTDEFAIEVKESRGWKSAMGQALAYAHFLQKSPAIYLIGAIPKECYEVCETLNIKVFDWKQFP